MDVGQALASLISNASTLETAMSNSLGFQLPDSVAPSDSDEGYCKVQVGSLYYASVPLMGITGKLSPLPNNLEGNCILCFLSGSKQAPILIFTSCPQYKEVPSSYGWVGSLIVDDLLYYNYGAGFIPIAPYNHKHFAGTGTQNQDSGGDFQQPVKVELVEKTGWELGYN
jgi:hypothetical protein